MPQPMTIGRIVRYTYPNGENAAGARTVPAIVTAVHADDCVNLHIFPDYPGPPSFGIHRTSISRAEVEGVEGTWAWPPRPVAADAKG